MAVETALHDYIVLTNRPEKAQNYNHKKVYSDCHDESEAIARFVKSCRCEDTAYEHKCNVYRADDKDIKQIVADWERTYLPEVAAAEDDGVTLDELMSDAKSASSQNKGGK